MVIKWVHKLFQKVLTFFLNFLDACLSTVFLKKLYFLIFFKLFTFLNDNIHF